MNVCRVSLAFIFLRFLITLTNGSNDNPTHFTGDVSINCGSTRTSVARNGREWLGDTQPKPSSLLQLKGLSAASSVIHMLTSADPVPHRTARISHSQFSYVFQVNPGQKIIRLHFNPTPYRGFKGFKDLFTVEAGPFTLLSNFSASLTADALVVNSFAKEFCLYIQENKRLNIVFTPENSQSIDTHAFVNGIEIISVPDSLSYFHGGDIGLQAVGQQSLVYVDNGTALEIVHRLNIEQDPVSSTRDSDDLFPKWAMQKADKMKSNTWKIPVDVGFKYLIRLHFSELGLMIAGSDDVMFEVLISRMVAYTNTDIGRKRGENNILRYRDCILTMRGLKREGKRDILISLQSYDKLVDANEVFTRFEIVKLSNTDNSLASPNPLPPPQDAPSQTIRILHLALGHRNAIAAFAIAIISLVNITIHKLREIWEASSTQEENKPSARAERLCRHFSLAEIELATRNFSDGLVIGRGGFGKVYKGLIDEGQKTVAVKRLKSNSKQGAREFLTEIETLSELRHVNLVSLTGYCNENGEMILVYDYVGGGTLAEHLYKLPRESINSSFLTWKQRLNICIGAARGLDYLHTGHGVIHRDVKASNILLDENFVAKVCDFGLARAEEGSKLRSHVSTNVKGTFGYFDPNYFRTRKLTRKSDTYSYGVVLLEVLCGRPAVDSGVEEDQRYLPWWVREKVREGEVDQIVDSSLQEEISPDSLKTFVGVAERCLSDEPKNRPTMSQVVLQLELALDQQENKQNLVVNEIESASEDETDIISVNTGQPTMASAHVQNLKPPPEKQIINIVVNAHHVPSGSKRTRKATIHKPSRPWPWGTLWNRVKPSKKSELLLSGRSRIVEICEEIREVAIRLAKYDWATIAAATNHFSSSNIVGHGGFGKVYKAVLPTGQVVAVKRRSPSSTQGLEEFKNEIVLLSNLQHRNIIKLLGYCIHRDENLLVHEFMENTSLDTFIDEAQHQCRRLVWLLWSVRFKIIMGIARGLVYLHQDSRMRVIHRNLNSSNILLDIDMNPKITDFDFARTLVQNQYELETTETAGMTSSYMPPEYVTQGKFSVKSDVYSFGIIVLEIVSGRRVWDVAYGETIMFLPSNAWKLWKEGNPLNLVDNLLGGAFPVDEALRCIQVGLLCTQRDPNCRPEMPSVLKILEGEEPQVELQVEKQEPGPPRDDLASSTAHTDEPISNSTFELDDTLER